MIPGMQSFGRRYRHVQRYRQIATVLLRHGFGDFVASLGLYRYLRFWRWRRPPAADQISHVSRSERIRLAMEELGTTFIKLGQILSTRRDLLSDALIIELEKLQDAVNPFPGESAKQVVEEELGGPLEQFFAEFELVPFASASIAQVHKAKTRAGEQVVVKVRRPGIEAVIDTDLEIMADLAELMEKHVEGAEVFSPISIVREFSRIIRRELDFPAEAGNLQRFKQSFHGDPRIYVPVLYRSLSTNRILTMEYVHGTKVSNLRELEQRGLDKKIIAQRGVELIFEQVFKHSVYHADPHPGNLLVLPGNVICLLDYGMIGILTRRYREELSSIIMGLVARDERKIAAAVFRLSGFSQFERTDEVESDIAKFAETYYTRTLGEVCFGEALNELARLLLLHNISLPPDFFLLSKALAIIEGIGRWLVPDFDVAKHLEPLVKELQRQRLSPRRLASEAVSMASELHTLILDLPSEAREMISLFKHGNVRVKFEHRGLESMIRTHDQISNRLSYAIVLAALIVGSSIMVLSDVPPKWHEVPLLGLVGFVISGLMGFGLLYSILKHGRM